MLWETQETVPACHWSAVTVIRSDLMINVTGGRHRAGWKQEMYSALRLSVQFARGAYDRMLKLSNKL